MAEPRKAEPRKTESRETGSRETAPREDAPRKTASRQSESRRPEPAKAEPTGAAGSATPGAGEILRTAQQMIAELTGTEAESVSSVSRGEDGSWTLSVEVVELRRIPDTTSLLGSYEISLDRSGELLGYRRIRRYERGRADPT